MPFLFHAAFIPTHEAGSDLQFSPTRGKDHWCMIYEFNADNVLEMAVSIEKNGAEFYRAAARKVSNGKAKQILAKLALEEDQHEKLFSEMRGRLSDKQKSSPGFNLEGNVGAYLHALADTRIFYKRDFVLPDTQADGDTTALLKSIYISAIRAEKESIVFYVGLSEMVPEAFGRSRVQDIIQEEMVHLTRLSKELAAL